MVARPRAGVGSIMPGGRRRVSYILSAWRLSCCVTTARGIRSTDCGTRYAYAHTHHHQHKETPLRHHVTRTNGVNARVCVDHLRSGRVPPASCGRHSVTLTQVCACAASQSAQSTCRRPAPLLLDRHALHTAATRHTAPRVRRAVRLSRPLATDADPAAILTALLCAQLLSLLSHLGRVRVKG